VLRSWAGRDDRDGLISRNRIGSDSPPAGRTSLLPNQRLVGSNVKLIFRRYCRKISGVRNNKILEMDRRLEGQMEPMTYQPWTQADFKKRETVDY